MKKIATVIVFQECVYNSMFNVLFNDLLKERDTFCIVEKSFPHAIFYQILLSKKLRMTTRIFERLIIHSYILPQKVKELSKDYEHIRVLFHNVSLQSAKYPLCVFTYLRCYHATFNMLYLDKYDHMYVCESAHKICDEKVCDRIFSFDPQDAEEHGFLFTNTPYSKLPEEEQPIKRDLYYCGGDLSRAYQLYRVSKAAKEHSVSLQFDISGCGTIHDFFEETPGVILRKSFLSYPEVVKNVLQSRCILDITQKGQRGLTLRPYEAVVYNRKLLTNNPAIKEFSYYDPRYMRYFEKVEDIDFEWIKTPGTVDYFYQGEFSPIYLAEKLL